MRILLSSISLLVLILAQPAQAYSPTIKAVEAAVHLAFGYSLPDEFDPAAIQHTLCDKPKAGKAKCSNEIGAFHNRQIEILSYLEMAKEAEIAGSQQMLNETLTKLSAALGAYRSSLRTWYGSNIGKIKDIPIPPLRPAAKN